MSLLLFVKNDRFVGCIVCFPHIILATPRLDVRDAVGSPLSVFFSRAPRHDGCEQSLEISVIYCVSPLHFAAQKYFLCVLCPRLLSRAVISLHVPTSYPSRTTAILQLFSPKTRVQANGLYYITN